MPVQNCEMSIIFTRSKIFYLAFLFLCHILDSFCNSISTTPPPLVFFLSALTLVTAIYCCFACSSFPHYCVFLHRSALRHYSPTCTQALKLCFALKNLLFASRGSSPFAFCSCTNPFLSLPALTLIFLSASHSPPRPRAHTLHFGFGNLPAASRQTFTFHHSLGLSHCILCSG